MFQHVPSSVVPYPHICIETSSNNSLAVKSNGINLTVVALQRLQASTLGDAPNPSKGIVATGYDNVIFDLETPYTRLVSNKNISAQAGFDVPYTERSIPRARDGGVFVCHFEAPNCRRVAP